MPVQAYGTLQRGQINSQEFGVYDFSGGLNVRDVPQMVPDNCLVQAYNGYISAAGGFQMRNGMAKYHTSLGSSPIIGLARFYQQVINAVPQSPIVKYTLAEMGGELWNVEAGTMLGSVGGTNVLPWTFVRAQDPSPGHISGLTDIIVICTGVGGPYIWDGTTLYSPSGWNAAAGARWCCIVNGTVWFGGIPSNPRAIYGTGTGVGSPFEGLPGYNNFIMSSPVTGLCAMGEGATASLAVGMTNGLSLIYGTGPSNYVQQDIPCDGCVAGRTMIYYLGMLYYLGSNAFYVFDGQTEPQPISDYLQPWFINDTRVPGYTLAADRSEAYCQVYNNRLYLGYQSVITTLGYPDTFAVYDLRVQGWTVLQSTPGVVSSCLQDAPDDPDPNVMLVGSGAAGQVYTWDVITQTPQDDGAAITTIMQSKFYKLGIPGTNKALTRFYPEMFLAGPFTGTATVQTDYGLTTTSQIFNAAGTSQALGIWNVSNWNQAYWSSGLTYSPYGSPYSRMDFDNLEGDSFSFGISSFGQAAAWIFGGFTGVYRQQGRT